MRDKILPVLLQTTILFLLAIILSACAVQPVVNPTEEPSAPQSMVAPEPDIATTESTSGLLAQSRNTLILLDRPCAAYLPKGEIEGETILCGFVRVPWDRNNPDGATADLAYVILKATGDNPQTDAIVHISGGPGIGATLRDVVLEMIKRYAPLRQDRDIVLYDQRGMGHSQPFFECPYPNEEQSVVLREQLAATADSAISEIDLQNTFCQQEWDAQGYATSDISTAISAADLVDVMAALDYSVYNLYAISYGTRLAMAMMHHFPNDPLVRSVVLDSAYPLPEDKVNDFAAAPSLEQQTLFEAVFQTCASDPECALAYPDLHTRFYALVETLDVAPLWLEDGQSFDGDDLYRTVYPFNWALNHIAYQPRLVNELEQGNTETLLLLRSGAVPPHNEVTGVDPDADGFSDLLDAFVECSADVTDGDKMAAELVALWDASVDEISEVVDELCPGDRFDAVNNMVDTLAPGAFNGVIARFAPETVMGVNSTLNAKLSCTENFPFREEMETIESALSASGLPGFFVVEKLASMEVNGQGCEAWADALTEPTPSTYGHYPALILSGQFDYITPPEMAGIAAADIPQAQLVTVPNATHSILGNHGDCPTQIVEQFLTDPGRPVDTSCTAAMTVPWVMADDPLPNGQ